MAITCDLSAMVVTIDATFGANPDGDGLHHRSTAVLRFGFLREIPGAIAPCSRKFPCHLTGLCTSATTRRRGTLAGLERNSLAKRTAFARLTALHPPSRTI